MDYLNREVYDIYMGVMERVLVALHNQGYDYASCRFCVRAALISHYESEVDKVYWDFDDGRVWLDDVEEYSTLSPEEEADNNERLLALLKEQENVLLAVLHDLQSHIFKSVDFSNATKRLEIIDTFPELNLPSSFGLNKH